MSKILVLVTDTFIAVGHNKTIIFFKWVLNGIGENGINRDSVLPVLEAAQAAAFRKAEQVPCARCSTEWSRDIKSDEDFFEYMEKHDI